jgi:aspartyl/asparaginyl beta-hydroxylase (cupin superfamily)
MQLSNQDAERLVREGADALRQGRAAEARLRFEQVTATGRATAQIWLLLATACRAENDLSGEEAALDRLLEKEPRALRGHLMKGDCRMRAGDDRGAARFYRSGLLIAKGQRLPNDLLAEVRRVETALATLDARFSDQREASLSARGLPPGERSPRFQQSLDISAGRKQIFFQDPTAYFFPELPQIQFYDHSDFAWTGQVEAATDAIRDELLSLLSTGMDGFRPYIQSDPSQPRLDENPLLDSKNWSALFLYENGKRSDLFLPRCPRTWDAAQRAPLVEVAGLGPTVMFSLLKAGARINPHTGMFNTRLTCHLPLIVPPNCAFRVGNEVRQWEEGKLMIFDDTIEHEAWNNSAEDRVVLIFDIWRPELTEQERREVSILLSSAAPE